MNTEEKKNKVSSSLAFNIKAEGEAIEFYYNLLDLVTGYDKDLIKGIIEDEMNHLIILQKILERQSGVLPSEFESVLTLKEKKEGN